MQNFAGPVVIIPDNVSTFDLIFALVLASAYILLVIFTLVSWLILLTKKLNHKKSPKLLSATKITSGIVVAVYIIFLIADNT